MSRIFHARWAEFLTLRGWLVATIAAAALVVGAIGAAIFAAGVAAAAVGAPLAERAMSVNGAVIYPVSQLPDLRFDAGPAELLAAAMVVALGLGLLLICGWVALGLGVVAAQLRRGYA